MIDTGPSILVRISRFGLGLGRARTAAAAVLNAAALRLVAPSPAALRLAVLCAAAAIVFVVAAATTCLMAAATVAPVRADEIPRLFYKQLPPYLPHNVLSACLVAHGASQQSLLCALNDGSVIGMLYETDGGMFVFNTIHHCDDPIFDFACCRTRDKMREGVCVAGLGARRLHVFSSDLALLSDVDLGGREDGAFFIRGSSDVVAGPPAGAIYFCRGASIYSLNVKTLATERVASFADGIANAVFFRSREGETRIVGLTRGGDLWSVFPGRGVLWEKPLGLRPSGALGELADETIPLRPYPLCAFKNRAGGRSVAVAHMSVGTSPGPWQDAAGTEPMSAVTCFEIRDAGVERSWELRFPGDPVFAVMAAHSNVYVGGGRRWTGLGTGGWLRRYDLEGNLLGEARATGAVKFIETVGGQICMLDSAPAVGVDMCRCLSAFTPSLRRLWTESCPMRPVRVLTGDIGGDELNDIVVVGNSTGAGVPRRGSPWMPLGEVDCYINKMGELRRLASLEEQRAARLSEGGEPYDVKAALSRARSIWWSLGDGEGVARSAAALAALERSAVVRRRTTVAVFSFAAALLAVGVWRRKDLAAGATGLARRLGLSPGAGSGAGAGSSAGSDARPGAAFEPPAVKLVMAVLAFQHSGAVRKGLARLRFNLVNVNSRSEAGREAAARAADLATGFRGSFIPEIEDIAFLLEESFPEGIGRGRSLHVGLREDITGVDGRIASFLDVVARCREKAEEVSGGVGERREGARESTGAREGRGVQERADRPDGAGRAHGVDEAAGRLDSACERLEDTVRNTARAVSSAFFCAARETVELVLEMEKERLEASGVTAGVRDMRPGEYGVLIRPYHLGFVLQNLVANSARAMEGCAVGDLSIMITGEAERTRIEVTDTGCGVPPEKTRALFHEGGGSGGPGCSQAMRGPKPRGGFGLLRSREVLAAYGGTIRLVSTRPGKGTTFAVELRTWPRGAPFPADRTISPERLRAPGSASDPV